jgi:MFS family permease
MVAAQTPPAGLFHPSRRLYRFTLLFIVSMLIYGSYFAFDSIGAIAPELKEKLGWTSAQIGTAYSMYSLAAIPIVLFGGILIDRLGLRGSSLIFSALVVGGSVIVAFSRSIGVLYVGRLVFGAGSEALIVTQNAILARWFKGKELALAFGLALMISRVGSIFSFNTEALVSKYYGGFQYALWAAVLFCVVSLICNLIYIVMDRHGERSLDLPSPAAGDRISFGDIGKFGTSFWLVTALCVTFYSAVFPFTSLSTVFFHSEWGIPKTAGDQTGGFFMQAVGNFRHMFSTAGGITSIPMFASMCLAPFAGYLVDKVGRRATLMIIGSILFVPAHLVMGFSELYPAYPMMLLGVAFVLVPAAMWPSIPLLVPEERVGTAYGIVTAIQNIGLLSFPYLNGTLADTTGSYSASQTMFAGLGLVGLVCAVLLLMSDKKAGRVLELPEVKTG